MSLKNYHDKRNFNKTSEPRGALTHDHAHFFCIQKHAASHLHYDFRLELDGVLLSWAVPKGPCFDPKVKRLAIHAEDHPVEYGFFEGIIPKGEYGGGTVMLWDKGRWIPLDNDPVKAYHDGHLRFNLEAEKLKGRWDLLRFKDEKNWFLIKHHDLFDKKLDDYDVTLAEPNSVITHHSIEEIKQEYQAMWTKSGGGIVEPTLPKGLKATPFPGFIKPQLATLVDKPPSGSDWFNEVKFDGYRMIALIENGNVQFKSRNNKDWTAQLRPLAKSLQIFKKNLIVDGEIVVLDEEGRSNFQLLQNAIKAKADSPIIYYVFDILYYDRFDLRHLTLAQRKAILKQVLPQAHGVLRYSDHILGDGDIMYKQSCDYALEGIVCKKKNMPYVSRRGKTWLKVKCLNRQEFVIGGYSPPQGERTHFGSLFLGIYHSKGQLEYVGNVGTGFDQSTLKSLHQELLGLESSVCPFNKRPPRSARAHWVKPQLVAEVEFSEWTADGHLRHPSFKGLRLDKKASQVGKEKEIALEELVNKNKEPRFKITHPDKIIYPKDGISKKDMLSYYEAVYEFIMPHLKNRLLSLLRCPKDVEHCFFQRHFNTTTAKQLHDFSVISKGVSKPYIYLDSRAGLLSLVQMGVLEIHPWGSTIADIEKPDYIVFDLDPAPGISWKVIAEAARDIRAQLEQLGLNVFLKTTGGKGLHLVIPILPEYPWEEVKQFTHLFVQYLEKRHPQQYISTMSKEKRKGKIFIDYLRNQRGATAIAAYSPRARPHAPVSVPIHWDELSNDKRDSAFTIANVPQRLLTLRADPWESFWTVRQYLPLDE